MLKTPKKSNWLRFKNQIKVMRQDDYRFKLPVKIVQPLDYLFIFRPTLFFPIWIITLAGYSIYFMTNDQLTWWKVSVNWKVIMNFVFLTFAAGGTFILNQIRDIGTDQDNKKLFLISENHIKPGIARIIAYVSMGLALIVFLIQSLTLFILLAVFLIAWGYFYNFKPFVWKDKPWMGVWTNVFAGFVLFLIGWNFAGSMDQNALINVIPYLFAWGSIALLTTVPDMKGDAVHSKETFSVKYGIRTSVWVSTIWAITAFAVGMILDDPIITHAILISLPLYAILVFKMNVVWVLRTIRYSMFFLAMFICFEFPVFFVVILINFYLAKIYYISRFDLDYPTFRVEEE